MKQLLDILRIHEADNMESRKATLILLWAPTVIVTWRTFGSLAYYRQHLSAGFAIAGNPSMTAELYTSLAAFLLFGLLSLALIRVGFRERIGDYGLRLGDWRFGLKALAWLGPAMALLSVASSRNAQFVAEYPLDATACGSVPAFLRHAAAYLVYYVGFEIFFRGFLQQGLTPRLGVWPAILVQTALSCLIHIGKPTGEVYGSIAGGLVFGLVAARSRSLLWVVLLHFILGITLDLAICSF